MKYSVEIQNDNGIMVGGYVKLSKKEAVATAQDEGKKNPKLNVFVTWFRPSDGQHGYLNPNGSHAITGQAW